MKNTKAELLITSSGKARGSVLIAHGLNSRANSMLEVADHLRTLGLNVYLVTLRGHRPEDLWPSDLNYKDWIEDVRQAYAQAQQDSPNLPIYGLGYSTGATTILALMTIDKNTKFEKLFFIAPAIELQRQIKILSILKIFSFTGLSLPSVAPPDYRAASHTSLKAYRALFDLIDIAKTLPANQELPPLLVVQSKEDELLSFNRTAAWIRSKSLGWNIIELTGSGDRELPVHLMIDRRSLGDSSWEKMQFIINEFFN